MLLMTASMSFSLPCPPSKLSHYSLNHFKPKMVTFTGYQKLLINYISLVGVLKLIDNEAILPEAVLNLSLYPLKENEVSLFTKGLKFIRKPSKPSLQ